MDGSHETDGRLGRADAGQIVPDDGVGREIGADVPRESCSSTGPRRPYGLGSGDHRHRQRALGDLRGGPIDQPLRGVPADGGDLAKSGGHAGAAGELGGRSWSHLGHHVDHGQAVDPVPEPGHQSEAESQARVMRSTGVTSSVRSRHCPDATMTGTRSAPAPRHSRGSGRPHRPHEAASYRTDLFGGHAEHTRRRN